MMTILFLICGLDVRLPIIKACHPWSTKETGSQTEMVTAYSQSLLKIDAVEMNLHKTKLSSLVMMKA